MERWKARGRIDDRVYMIRFGFTVTVAAAHHNSHPFLKIISSWTHIRSAAVLVPVTSDTPCSANIRCICIVFILTIGVERVKMYVSLSTLYFAQVLVRNARISTFPCEHQAVSIPTPQQQSVGLNDPPTCIIISGATRKKVFAINRGKERAQQVEG